MYDLHIDRALSVDAAAQAIARALGPNAGSVAVIDDLAAMLDVHADTVVVRRISGGDFITHLDIYARQPGPELPSELALAKTIAGVLSCRCLISDADANPYTWTLISPDGGQTPVSVDADALSAGELTVARSILGNDSTGPRSPNAE